MGLVLLATVGFNRSAPELGATSTQGEASAEGNEAATGAVQLLRQGVQDRRSATWKHQDWLSLPRTKTAYRERQVSAVPYLRWLKQRWALRAHTHWKLRAVTLRDFPFCDGCRAWLRAVEEVQRVFPGTSGWLLSCSAAEGGHGRWVGYSGVAYSAWLRDSDTVGGNLQFRFSTFKGMYRRAVDYVREREYRVPAYSSFTAAWRSSTGQALAGGWARYTGNDNAHWSASWGRGC